LVISKELQYFSDVNLILLEDKTNKIVNGFIDRLFNLRESLLKDVNHYLENDPATKNIAEVILGIPGFRAITS